MTAAVTILDTTAVACAMRLKSSGRDSHDLAAAMCPRDENWQCLGSVVERVQHKLAEGTDARLLIEAGP
jgi:hypothetical protein